VAIRMSSIVSGKVLKTKKNSIFKQIIMMLGQNLKLGPVYGVLFILQCPIRFPLGKHYGGI